MSLENIPLVLYPGDSWQLTFEASPDTKLPIKWASSNPNVCRVSVNGLLLAHAPGKTVINVGGLSQAIHVGIHVTGMKIEPSSKTLKPGEQFQLAATIVPNNATDHGITWSSDSACCKVSPLGLVTAVSVGEAHITAQSDDQGYKSTATITVEKPQTLISFGVQDIKIYVGKTYEPKLKITPNTPVKWSISDSTIASINTATGQIKGIKPGHTEIIATHEDSSATIKVTVAAVPFRR